VRKNVAAAAGRMAQAVGDCERAIRLDPNLLDASINISLALREQGRYAEALKYLDICKERFSSCLPVRDREDIDRLSTEIKALKGGN
jgi:tetratricopeptide (TPR) repeat protein